MDGSASEAAESSAFAGGSALALLHVVLHDPTINVPSELLRNRQALRAAAHCLKLEGRGQTEADIRDTYLLTAADDDMGPAGDMLKLWRTGSAISFRQAGWRDRLQGLLPEEMQEYFPNWMEQAEESPGIPIARAGSLLGKMVQSFPRQESVALLCADVVLARSLGWDRTLPLFGLHLKSKALRAASQGEDVRIACHEAVTHASHDAVRSAYDFSCGVQQMDAWIKTGISDQIKANRLVVWCTNDGEGKLRGLYGLNTHAIKPETAFTLARPKERHDIPVIYLPFIAISKD